VPERFVPVVRDQRAAVLGAIANLTADDWVRPTICDAWTVKDVVSHLVENELLFGAAYRGELQALDADSQAGVDRWATVDGDTVRYSLWHHGQATQRVIDSRSDESWLRPIGSAGPPGELQLRHALRLHFVELAVHGHDVTSAVGAPNAWGDRAGRLVEYCLRAAPAVLARKDHAAAGTLEVRIEELDPMSLDGRPGAWRFIRGSSPDPTIVWITDAETMVLATTGRLPAAHAIERSRVEGDAAALDALLGVWNVTG
jgi:uncharacterized protein (TIGR03083 family)